jgi:CYTH domain-containing protein
MLGKMCVTPIIEKVRHWVEHAGMTWEVDVFHGEAFGLVLAEVELDRIDQPLVLPPWVGAEVTDDVRYRSAGVAQGLWRVAAAQVAMPARAQRACSVTATSRPRRRSLAGLRPTS